ncbi:MAG: nucleoside triphosphate pyrophosphohydrolase [Armatimonadetes bacterium]|nr:nucleoside triphosphate pyrophosphohydrolase [Armatimonadota bacterium]MBX3107648.1 nucleoside triphosphate pyrophosphohydrolase [Fimbriimonadaceae bacterium]
MTESAEALLSRFGLAGPYQVHYAPLVLAIDQRAHQVFYGFGPELPDRLRQIYGQEFPVGDPLVVPAQDQFHAGGLPGLVQVVDRLLGPGGCPWDIEQTHTSLKKYLLEESYELFEAIDSNDLGAMREELGDVLLQPLMHAQIRRRDGDWGIDEVARGITDKLIRRHPHVFGGESAADSEAVLKNWDAVKRAEKEDPTRSILAGIPHSMPALMLAMEVSKRAARAGFEWPDIDGVWEKFREEESELREALASGSREDQASELGDLLFTVVNLARWAKIDPEEALRQMVARFRLRFQSMESLAGKALTELSADEWDQLWNEAKAAAASDQTLAGG